MSQMTPYLKAQLSTLSAFQVLDPEPLIPAESGTPVQPAPAQQQESKGQEHDRQGEKGTWSWIPTLAKRRRSPTCETSRGCSETWSAAPALPAGIRVPCRH